MRKKALLASAVLFFLAVSVSQALAGEDSVFREISRCDDMKELVEKARDITKDFNLSGSDAETVKVNAARVQAYMSYIIVRQNELLAKALGELKADAPQ